MAISILLPGLLACHADETFRHEGDALLASTSLLHQKFDSLQTQTNQLWDSTTQKLAVLLPADFPAVDRDIFLHARNADHIRMFESYKTLPSEAQQLVDSAGRQDKNLAMQMRYLQHEFSKVENMKNTFLDRLSREDIALYNNYIQQFSAFRFPELN